MGAGYDSQELYGTAVRILFNRHILGKHDYEPRASFHLGQWNAAAMLGFKFRYFTNSHTPHQSTGSWLKIISAKTIPCLKRTFLFVSVTIHNSLLSHFQIICSCLMATGILPDRPWLILNRRAMQTITWTGRSRSVKAIPVSGSCAFRALKCAEMKTVRNCSGWLDRKWLEVLIRRCPGY